MASLVAKRAFTKAIKGEEISCWTRKRPEADEGETKTPVGSLSFVCFSVLQRVGPPNAFHVLIAL